MLRGRCLGRGQGSFPPVSPWARAPECPRRSQATCPPVFLHLHPPGTHSGRRCRGPAGRPSGHCSQRLSCVGRRGHLGSCVFSHVFLVLPNPERGWASQVSFHPQTPSWSFREHFKPRNLRPAKPTGPLESTTRNSVGPAVILRSAGSLSSHKYMALPRPHSAEGRTFLSRVGLQELWAWTSTPIWLYHEMGTLEARPSLLVQSLCDSIAQGDSPAFLNFSPFWSSFIRSSGSWADPSLLADKSRNQG